VNASTAATTKKVVRICKQLGFLVVAESCEVVLKYVVKYNTDAGWMSVWARSGICTGLVHLAFYWDDAMEPCSRSCGQGMCHLI
jgi:hypothetical protein